MTEAKATQVVLLYKRGSQPDEDLIRLIETQLVQNGFPVFIDRHLAMGVDWAREIEARIRSAAAVIPLLSAEAIHSEMLGFEIETAHEAAQLNKGRPRLLSVRVNYTGPLPEPLASILDPIQYFLWESEADNLGLVTELIEALRSLSEMEPATESNGAKNRSAGQPLPSPAARPMRPPALESVGGAVPLNSDFYLARSADGELRAAISNRDSIILIKGARQMGKTSLLARGLHPGEHAWRRGAAPAHRRTPRHNPRLGPGDHSAAGLRGVEPDRGSLSRGLAGRSNHPPGR